MKLSTYELMWVLVICMQTARLMAVGEMRIYCGQNKMPKPESFHIFLSMAAWSFALWVSALLMGQPFFGTVPTGR